MLPLRSVTVSAASYDVRGLPYRPPPPRCLTPIVTTLPPIIVAATSALSGSDRTVRSGARSMHTSARTAELIA
jgi:hypothetical protein